MSNRQAFALVILLFAILFNEMALISLAQSSSGSDDSSSSGTSSSSSSSQSSSPSSSIPQSSPSSSSSVPQSSSSSSYGGSSSSVPQSSSSSYGGSSSEPQSSSSSYGGSSSEPQSSSSSYGGSSSEPQSSSSYGGSSSEPQSSSGECEWIIGDAFTECSVSCGQGVFSHVFTCELDGVEQNDTSCCGNYTGVIDYWACNLGECSSSSSSSVDPCTIHHWVTTELGECNVICGTGLSNRKVLCIGPSYRVRVDSKCYHHGAGDKPDCSELCALNITCEPGQDPTNYNATVLDNQWATSSWSTCSTTCGVGEQTRIALCIGEDNAVTDDVDCDSDSKPETSSSCQLAPCDDSDDDDDDGSA